MNPEAGRLSPRTASDQGQSTKGWEKLAALVDPAIAQAPGLEPVWKVLDRKAITYLLKTVTSQAPWFNHLMLALLVFTSSRMAHPRRNLSGLHRLLRWAIPAQYPSLAAFKVPEAIISYFGNSLQQRGRDAFHVYSSLQFHLQAYLTSLTATERQTLAPYTLPLLVDTAKLTKLCAAAENKTRQTRKEQVHAIVRDFTALIAMGRRRYRWLAELDGRVQQTLAAAASGQIALPAVITCRDLDDWEDVTFRVWDRKSWMTAHRDQYSPQLFKPSHKDTAKNVFFLQLVGAMPHTSWFLEAVEHGALVTHPAREGRDYLKTHRATIWHGYGDLLIADLAVARFIRLAQSKARGTVEDSRVLFCVEPLLAGAALGLYALVCFTQTAMRMGEFQQVTLDNTCIKTEVFPQFGGVAEERMFWYLYPKGTLDERQPYAITPMICEALTIWMQTHERFCGKWRKIPAEEGLFTHLRRFPDTYKFVLQWQGHHLSARRISVCLDFLLFEHTCLDAEGNPVRLTAHAFRHGLATYLRNKGISLEDIARLLHQINTAVTAYYSDPSKHDLYTLIGPSLTELDQLTGNQIDPMTIRTPADIERHIQSALGKFGMLCHLSGGYCTSLQSCEVHFRCAACSSFAPDPCRRQEVVERIDLLRKHVVLDEASGDLTLMKVHRAQQRDWERVLFTIDALAVVPLPTRPLAEMLDQAGVKNTSSLSAKMGQRFPKRLPEGGAHG